MASAEAAKKQMHADSETLGRWQRRVEGVRRVPAHCAAGGQKRNAPSGEPALRASGFWRHTSGGAGESPCHRWWVVAARKSLHGNSRQRRRCIFCAITATERAGKVVRTSDRVPLTRV